MRFGRSVSIVVGFLVFTGGSGFPRAIGAPSIAGGAVTIMFGRGTVQLTNYSCSVLPGSVSLFAAAQDLRERELAATIPMTVSHIGEGDERICNGGNLYANWTDLAELRDTYGWTVVPRGLTNDDLTLKNDPATLEANICGALEPFESHGHHDAWGMFAWPQNRWTLEYQERYVTPCYAYGRRYAGLFGTTALPAPFPYWAMTVSENGGKCANATLPCHTFTPRGNRDYMQPQALAATIDVAADKRAWVLLQFYGLVQGNFGQMGERFAWDCRSSDPADHWTSYSEIYCWDDYREVVSSIPATATVTDPASVAGLSGRKLQPDTSEIGEAGAAGIYEDTRSWAANIADFNSDGYQDFLLVRHSQIARLYRNDGDGTFTEVNSGAFVKNDRHDCAWADVDQDELLDAYCTLGDSHGDGEGPNELWIQQPDGTFVDRAGTYGVTDRFGRGSHTTFLDVNHDAYPDLFVGNDYPRTDGLLSPNRLFINQGGTSFTAAPGHGLDHEVGAFCVDAADYNNDGWEDLLICGRKSLTLYRNESGVSFTNVSAAMRVGRFWRSARLVDVSGDGLLDLVTIRPSAMQVRLRVGGSFASPVVTQSLNAGRDVATGDFDADGAIDLYLLQGATSSVSNHPDMLLLNDGMATSFTPAQIPQTSRGRGDAVEPIDYNSDGSEDFIVLNGEGSASGPIQLITR